MRVVLVGPSDRRGRLRLAVRGADVEIVGEADTLQQARELHETADAYLLASIEPAVEPTGTARQDDLEPLTAREQEVLRLLADGLSNKAIAGRLGISDQTVKFHVAAIAGKLDAPNRTAAVRAAIRKGLVDI